MPRSPPARTEAAGRSLAKIILSEYRITRAIAGDLEKLHQLDAEIFLTTCWSKAQWNAELLNPHATILLLACGIVPCGFISAGRSGDDLEIHKIGILAEHRRHGWAGRLLRHVIAEQASPALRCLIEVSETNTVARAFYHAIGFTELSRRKNYYPDGSTAIIMEKILCSP